jgi:hypothetical protein
MQHMEIEVILCRSIEKRSSAARTPAVTLQPTDTAVTFQS